MDDKNPDLVEYYKLQTQITKLRAEVKRLNRELKAALAVMDPEAK